MNGGCYRFIALIFFTERGRKVSVFGTQGDCRAQTQPNQSGGKSTGAPVELPECYYYVCGEIQYVLRTSKTYQLINLDLSQSLCERYMITCIYVRVNVIFIAFVFTNTVIYSLIEVRMQGVKNNAANRCIQCISVFRWAMPQTHKFFRESKLT